jgi:phosphoglucosamine mutase
LKPKKLFGTDGIRGEAGKFPLDVETVRVIGASLARHLSEAIEGRPPRIVIGRDTRESGTWIEREVAAGALKEGAQVQSAGVITTPGVAFLTRALPADAGVVISASHNPYQDNGIKVFAPSGRKLDDATERRIESDVAAQFPDGKSVDSTDTCHQESDELRKRYLDYLRHDVAQDLSLHGLKMVVDCANGAAYKIGPQLFSLLGARVIAINNQPDGKNINRDCGSLHIEGLQEIVVKEGAALGVAFDGDADRALFVDAEGNFVDGDSTMWIMANYLKSRGHLTGNKVVATVMTNVGLEIALRSQGILLVRTNVGDKYVLEELIRSEAVLGGEQSGHIIFPELSLAGDGMLTAIGLLRAMREENKSLAQLNRGFQRYPQVLLNVRVREKVPFESMPAVKSLAHEVEHTLGNSGRLLLRYSGTESLARVMIEGADEDQVRSLAQSLADKIRSEIGAANA